MNMERPVSETGGTEQNERTEKLRQLGQSYQDAVRILSTRYPVKLSGSGGVDMVDVERAKQGLERASAVIQEIEKLGTQS